jgi:hypothetical protein
VSRYAENTSVSTEKSRSEIESTLRRYGASSFVYGWDADQALVEFSRDNLRVRILIQLPNRFAREFTHTPERGNLRSAAQAEASWEQACRQRWRALALVVKAKLEAVEAGITTFQEEFLSFIVLEDGRRIGDVIDRKALERGSPSLLGLPSGSVDVSQR